MKKKKIPLAILRILIIIVLCLSGVYRKDVDCFEADSINIYIYVMLF